MLCGWKFNPCLNSRTTTRGFCCRAGSSRFNGFESSQVQGADEKIVRNKKKVLVVGSGWAGLGAAYHLCKQGFDVTTIEGGIDSGLSPVPYSPDEVGIQGFWYPYRNIFSIVDELGLAPFTNWMKSTQYSKEGVEVEFPVFQDQTQLPTPLGTLIYTQFTRLPIFDRLISLPLMLSVVDFDNTDGAWTKYDPVTAREFLRQIGCSEKLFYDILKPLIEIRLFAPAEQCSAASTLAVLYYYALAHQRDFDLRLCRGTVREKIFDPWKDVMRSEGCKFRKGRGVSDFFFNEETGCISEVLLGNERVKADAVILAVGISELQDIIMKSSALCAREEFLKVLNLSSVDVLSVKLRVDSKVTIPKACNACSGFDGLTGWTFFDLNATYEEHENDPVTVVQADFYNANEFSPLSDEQIATKVLSYLSKCVEGFKDSEVIDKEILRFPRSLPHFFPGSYKYMMRGTTSFPNLFMAGDWIVNRHGSWSQEKAYVTGLEAANMVLDHFEEGNFARILPVEEDEPHVQALRELNRNFEDIISQFPLSGYFLG